MSTITTYMSLTAWTATSDPYSHTQLANNFQAIDGHDHTSGKGKQIPTGGLVDHSVTTIKLAEPAVNTTNLYDHSVTLSKLDVTLLGALIPMGLVFGYWRPSGSVAVCWGNRASGHLFELCDGRTIVGSEHDIGGGSLTLPNLIDRFPLYGIEADIRTTGGANTVSLAHAHTVNAHSHAVNAHSHTVNVHSHSVPDHQHVVPNDTHRHTFEGGFHVHSRKNAIMSGASIQGEDAGTIYHNTLQSAYIAGFNHAEDDDQALMDNNTHNHGGQTGLVSTGALATGDATPGTSNASPGTDAQSPGTSSGLGSHDNRPAFMKLVPIVRVRNP